MLWVKETEVNRTEGLQCGKYDPYETSYEDVGELFQAMQKEYGRCCSKMYCEPYAIQVGWVFEKAMDYRDCDETYIRETWVEVFVEKPQTIPARLVGRSPWQPVDATIDSALGGFEREVERAGEGGERMKAMKTDPPHSPLRFLTHIPEEDTHFVRLAAKVTKVDVRVSKKRLAAHKHPDPQEGWTSLYSSTSRLTLFWQELNRLRLIAVSKEAETH